MLLCGLSYQLIGATTQQTHWKRPWCWEGLGVGGEGDDRGWDGWMASRTWWAWVWVNSGSLWWTGRPGVLRFMGSQRVGHDWATELNWTELTKVIQLIFDGTECRTQFSQCLSRFYSVVLFFPDKEVGCLRVCSGVRGYLFIDLSQAYLISLCFALLHFTDFAVFTNWTSVASLCPAS